MRAKHVATHDVGANTLAEIVRALEKQGVTVLIKGVPEQHMSLMRSVGVIDALRDRRHLFDAFPAALEHARSHVRRNDAARNSEVEPAEVAPEERAEVSRITKTR